MMANNNYDFLTNGEPTYWPSDPKKAPDLLDFFVISGITRNNCTIESNADLTSDHTPVIMSLSTTVIKKLPPPKLTTRNTDWTSLQRHLESTVNLNLRMKSPEDIDDAVQHFTRVVQDAAWKSTPQSRQTETTTTDTPLYIRQLIAEKRRARRTWQRSRNAADQHIYNRLSRKLKKVLRDAQNNTFEHYITNLSANDNTLWKATRKLKRPQVHVPPLRKPNGQWARSDKEKADTFASHLADVFKTEPDDEEEEIEDYLNTPCQMSLPIKAFSPKEVKEEISRLNPRKAPGYDLITGQLLQALPKKAIVLLCTIFNAILRLSYFPTTWKYAEIIMVHKPGKPSHDPSSYRPISLLPVTSKVLERLLFKRIYADHELRTILPNHQFGFRKRHSTIHQVHGIVNEISKSLEEKRICHAVFLDISQAFDKIWHRGLLFKLKNSLSQNYYLLLQSYLSNRNFSVKHSDQQSTICPIKSGVPQGSVLGPLLFTIVAAIETVTLKMLEIIWREI
jgi:hypothetical protein